MREDIKDKGWVKKSLYPKTQRVGTSKGIVLTEKLDGSNLGFFKLDGELHIATRNRIYNIDRLEQHEDLYKELYKGLYEWLQEHGEELRNNINEKSCVFGEWIAMGRIKYGKEFCRFNPFAKANINEEYEISKLNYDLGLIKYVFINQEIPNFMEVVPIVAQLENYPCLSELDEIYSEYIKTKDRHVEGFVIRNGNEIKKYVRFKGGKMSEHIVQ
ncbi:RNA ligase family protein [Peptostreptococcus faecalis]|uniref:RNA ligase family protein n=1 Tax=Peptostreptococcus faecalis TaxID=2045015 RepID=UPI000C7C87F2|nr:RNA ligase family protein [Peptostreptococcus faecalis]